MSNTLGTAYNASDVSGTATTTSTRLETKVIKDQPIYVKVIPILSKKDAQGNFHKYLKYDQMPFSVVRNGKVEKWTRPSLELSGLTDPQKEYATSLLQTIKEWEKGGYDKLPEYAHQFNQMKQEYDTVKPQTKVALLVICPNDPKVHVLVTSRTITDQLFGKAAWGTTAAIESLTDSMRKNNEGDLFDLNSSKGWAKLSRSGSTFFDTRYKAETAKELRTITDAASGQTMSVPMVIDAPVHPAILALDPATLPDPVAYVNSFPWTVEEVNEYAQSGFKTLPKVIGERIAKFSQSEGQAAPQAGGPTPPPAPTGFQRPPAPASPPVVQAAPVQQVSAPQAYTPPPAAPAFAAPAAPQAYAQAPQQAPGTTNLAQFMAANLPPKVGG